MISLTCSKGVSLIRFMFQTFQLLLFWASIFHFYYQGTTRSQPNQAKKKSIFFLSDVNWRDRIMMNFHTKFINGIARMNTV